MSQLDKLTAEKNYQITGVSYFQPVDILFEAAHEWHVGRLKRNGIMGSQCFLFDPDKLPSSLGYVHDVCFTVAARDADHEKTYPEEFRELPRRSRKEKYPLALHYSVFPKERMLYSEFTAAITALKHLSCQVNGGGEDSSEDSGDHQSLQAAAYESMKAKLWLPSCMFMRVVTEALYNMFEDPTASPNDALLAFLLLHHIAAEDLPFAHYERDSVYSRLIYRAIQAYDKNVDCYDSPCDNMSACTALILKRLEAVLPTVLHIQESESDESSEGEGADCDVLGRGDLGIASASKGDMCVHFKQVIIGHGSIYGHVSPP